MAHAVLGPSSAKRWMTCPGSVRLSRGMPNRSSKYADEGTEAHALAEALIRAHMNPCDNEAQKRADDLALTATVEMMTAVNVYVDKVLSYLRAGFEVVLLLEQRVSLDSLGVDVWGTSDLIAYVPALRRLIVGDYKHGAGVAVEVEANPQLMIYALGAWVSIAMRREWTVESVETFICQPRKEHDDGPIRTHTYTLLDLIEFADEVIVAAAATDKPDAPLVAGEHCRFCPAKAQCPARVNAINAVVTVPGLPSLPSVAAMSVEQAAQVLAAADRVKFADWLDDVRAFLQNEAEAGRAVPGYKLVPKQGRRKWDKSEADVCDALAKFTPTADLYDRPAPALKSVAQVEKLIGKKNLPASLYVFEQRGYNLVPESAKGLAVTVHPGDEFEAIEPEPSTQQD